MSARPSPPPPLPPTNASIAPGQKIIVLRQGPSPEVQAEASLNRRTEEVAQAASALSARAARDIGADGRSDLWGEWGRGRRGGRGRGWGRGAAVEDRRPRVR